MKKLTLLLPLLFLAQSASAAPAPSTPVLSQGSSGPQITTLQQTLRDQGYFTADVTGYFGPITAKAVAAFQSANSLAAVGSVGPLTRALLGTLAPGRVLGASTPETVAPGSVAVGINLSGVSYWTTEQPFLNIFKTAGGSGPSGWITGLAGSAANNWQGKWDTGEESKLAVDQNGYPTCLCGKGGQAVTFNTVSVLFLREMPLLYPAGQYIVLYDGEGTVTYSFDGAKDTSLSTKGRDVLTVKTPSGAGILLTITATDPNHTGNYIRNIRVVKAEHEKLLEGGEIFNPMFIDRVKPFKSLRFMDWMNTNANMSTSRWADRSTPSRVTWAADGSPNGSVPVETMVALVNKIGADAWFNMPCKADDDFVKQFATYAHNNLGAKQKVYVEYVNEYWNGIFPCGRNGEYMEQQAQALWPQATGSFNLISNYYGMRSSQICEIWKGVWGADAKRVVCVMGTQTMNYGVSNLILDCPLWSQKPCSKNHGIDALAITAYFGPNEVSNSWTSDADGGLGKLFTELTQGGIIAGGYKGGTIQEAVDAMKANKKIADQYDIALAAYEGGPHIGFNASTEALQNLYLTAARDKRMGAAVTTLLQKWQAAGGPPIHYFSDIGSYSKWGAWGALENVLQTSSAKYDALIEFINNPPAPIPTATSTPTTATTLTPARTSTTTPTTPATTPSTTTTTTGSTSGVVAPSSTSSSSYTFRGIARDDNSTSVSKYSIDIGPASADRLVIVGVAAQNGAQISAVRVNGVALTQNVATVNPGVSTSAIYSGIVASGSGSQSITVTYVSAPYYARTVAVWTATGVSAKQTGGFIRAGNKGGPLTIPVAAGDTLFVIGRGIQAMPDFAGSTQPPTGSHKNPAQWENINASDWRITAANSSFTVPGNNFNDGSVAGVVFGPSTVTTDTRAPSLTTTSTLTLPVGASASGVVATPSSTNAASTPSAVFRGSATAGDPGNVETYPINIGSASTDRVVIVGVLVQNGADVTSVTIGGTPLTQAVDNANTSSMRAEIWSGSVPSGSGTQDIVVTTATGVYVERSILVWTATGLQSSAPRKTGMLSTSGQSFSIPVSNGDLLFALAAPTGAGTFNASSEDPSGTQGPVGRFGGGVYGADWKVMSADTSFLVHYSGSWASMAGATFR